VVLALLLLLPNKPPPVLLLFAPPKMLPPVFVLEPKPEDADGKLDIFEVHGAALIDRRDVSIVSRGRAEHAEKRRVCLPPLLLALLLLDPNPPNVDWVLLFELEPKPPNPPDPNDMLDCRDEACVYAFRS
jgi:hypothetical protein